MLFLSKLLIYVKKTENKCNTLKTIPYQVFRATESKLGATQP